MYVQKRNLPAIRRARRTFAPRVELCERLQLLTAGIGLAGHVFLDLNSSGALDQGESGVPGASVSLYSSDGSILLGQAQTGADGSYQFNDANNVNSGNLSAGDYQLVVTPPSGLVARVVAATSDTLFATVSSTASNLDFPTVSAASVSGQVYIDLNGNGIRDASDTPTANELIELTGIDDLGRPVDRYKITAADGSFTFNSLLPGSYRATNLQAGGKISGDNVPGIVHTFAGSTSPSGVLDGYDSITAMTLHSGDVVTIVTFSEVDTLIRGRTYRDVTGDGLDPNTDTPLGGVRVELYRDLNGNGKLDVSDGAAIAWTTSNATTGAYRFLNPDHVKFIVHEVVPTGYVRTAPVLTNDNAVTVCDCGIAHEGVNFANYLKPLTSAINNITYTVINPTTGTTQVSDLRGKVHQGDTVLVTFTVKAGQNPLLSLVSYTAPAASFNASTAARQEVFRIDTGMFSPGTHTLSVAVPNSFFQVDFVAGTVIDHFGPANSNIFYSAQSRLYSADNSGSKLAGASSISGYVYRDTNRDGHRQIGESGIAGVVIELTGFDYHGTYIDIFVTTGANGSYSFGNLAGSDAAGYSIRELPAQDVLASYLDGLDAAGSLGGQAGNDQIAGVVLNVNTQGTEYDFGEILPS